MDEKHSLPRLPLAAGGSGLAAAGLGAAPPFGAKNDRISGIVSRFSNADEVLEDNKIDKGDKTRYSLDIAFPGVSSTAIWCCCLTNRGSGVQREDAA